MRSKSGSGSYFDIFVALKQLVRVIRLVTQCYKKHPKVYKKLGPNAKNGGLKKFLTEVIEFKTFLEDSFYCHLRKLLPREMPKEILKMIWEFSQSGSRRFDFGFYSKNRVDQVGEA